MRRTASGESSASSRPKEAALVASRFKKLAPKVREALAGQGLSSHEDMRSLTITNDALLASCLDALLTADEGFSEYDRIVAALHLSHENHSNAFCDAMEAMQDAVLVRLYRSGLTSSKAMAAADLRNNREIDAFIEAAMASDFNKIQRVVAAARLKNMCTEWDNRDPIKAYAGS